MSFSSPKAASSRLRIAGIIIIFASIAVILTVGQDPLTKENVEGDLKRFSEYVATDTAKSGKVGTFTYGNIDIRGWMMNRYAVVQDVSLEVKKQSLLDSVSWALSTPVMAVVPDPMMARRLYYVFGDVLTLKKNDATVATVTFSEPLKYGQLEIRKNETRSMVQTFKLPGNIAVTPMGANGTPGEKVVIAYDANPTVQITSSLEKPLRDAVYEFHNLTVTAANEKPLHMGYLHSELHEKPTDSGAVEGHYTLAVTALKTDATAKPCDLSTDMAYTGEQPLLKIAGLVADTIDTSLNIKELTMDCADFKLSAEGGLTRSPQDPLPYGLLHVKIEQVKQLLASPLLGEQGRSLLSQVLVKVTSQPVEALANVDIPIKREKNSTLYIGDVTFEALAASLFSNMLDFKGTAVPQALPGASPEPKQAPAAPAGESTADPLGDQSGNALDGIDEEPATPADKPANE